MIRCEHELGIAKMFIQYKSDVNLSYIKGNTLLHLVCGNDDYDFLEVLLNCEDCDLNKRNDLNETPLFLACRNGSLDCVEILVESQCDKNRSNIEG